MALGGLWDAWKDPADARWLQSYTTIATDASEIMQPIHSRMPVILHEGDSNCWPERGEVHQLPVDLLR